MFPVRPESELLVVPVLSVVTELVTLDWLSSTTEPALPDEVLDETLLAFCETLVLEAPLDVTLFTDRAAAAKWLGVPLEALLG